MSADFQQLGKYKLQECLRRGGIAEVWKAFDIQFRRTVVIKILHAELQNNPDFMTYFWGLPLKREAQVIISLHHPNIAQIHGFYMSLPQASGNPLPYIVMDYVEGQSLTEYIHNTSFQGDFPSATDLEHLFASLAVAIDYAHQQGIIHGNIKPRTILLDQHQTSQNPLGEPVFLDFGIIRLLGIPVSLLSHWESETPCYTSPEQAEGHPATERSDIYALGVILYQICTGMLPFRGESAQDVMTQQVSTMPPAPIEINATISPAVSAIIMRSLARGPAERFSSATAMTLALEKALDISDSETLRLPSYRTNTINDQSSRSSAPSILPTALGSFEPSFAPNCSAQASPQPSTPASPLPVGQSSVSQPDSVGRSRRRRIKKSHIALIVALLILLVALFLAALLVLLHG